MVYFKAKAQTILVTNIHQPISYVPGK